MKGKPARLTIGIIAPSSAVPQIELRLGAERLRAQGFTVRVHPHCRKQHWFFAGDDEERATALHEYARDPSIDVLWCARGGYGAMRLLPFLEALTQKHGKPPRKLLAGYSDALVLNDFVRERWGWRALHAAMPGMREFFRMSPADNRQTLALVRGDASDWQAPRLKLLGPAPRSAIRGELVGGNLCVLAAMVGAKSFPKLRGRMLFLEDVDEPLYRIDRMIQQLILSDSLAGVSAIVLGDFSNCGDKVAKQLAKAPRSPAELARLMRDPRPEELKPLRRSMSERLMIPRLFLQLSQAIKAPLFVGFPAGHGARKLPLPLGARYKLERSGELKLLSWL